MMLQWYEFKSRRGKNTHLTAQKSNSNTVWFNFQTYICRVTSVSIHSFVEWLDTFSYVLRCADVTVKEVNHIRRFAIDIAKDLILLSCRLAMEHLYVLLLKTALATLATT